MSAGPKTIKMQGHVSLSGGPYEIGVGLGQQVFAPALEGALAAVGKAGHVPLLAGLITELCIQAEHAIGANMVAAILVGLLDLPADEAASGTAPAAPNQGVH